MSTPGSRAAHVRHSQVGADVLKARDWTDAELEARSERAKALGRRPVRWALTGWTAADDARLGTEPDAATAAATGRSVEAVYRRRYRLGVPRFRG